jgi:transposase
LELASDGTFAYSRNYTAIDEATKNYGYLCLITNFDIKSCEALEIYRRKDTIEKGFDDIKNHIDMKRLKTHLTATTNGKMFCAFIALIIICALTNFLRNSKELKLSKHEALAELGKIRLVTTNDGKRLINPLTKTQRLILEACGLASSDLLSYVC